MKVNFSSEDKQFMKLALDEASISLAKCNFPCGAILVADGEVIGKSRNEKETKRNRISHAEMLLYIEHSSRLKDVKKQGHAIVMYTTLEPCLMCFGAAVMHRVDRIVAATPDPFGNMSKIDGGMLGQFYDGNMPLIEYGLYLEESHELIKKYLLDSGTNESKEYMKLFENMNSNLEKL